MHYDLENINKMTGILTTTDNTAFVLDVYIEFNSITAKKLARVIRNNKVTRENQELYFDSITINKNSISVFTKGQGGLVEDGNRYIMMSSSPNPARFHGVMQTLVRGSDGYDYACDIEIGSIEFNLSHSKQINTEDSVTFEGVSGMIYPFGRYQAVVNHE